MGAEDQREQVVRNRGEISIAGGQRTGLCECARCFGTNKDARGSFLDGGGGLTGRVGEDCVDDGVGGFGGTLVVSSLFDRGSSG